MNAAEQNNKSAKPNADQVKFDEAELVVEHHESVAEPVQVNVAHPGASLAAPAMAETIVPGGAGTDSSPSIESGDAIPLPESTAQPSPTSQQSPDEIVLELASLEPLEYDKKRQEMADAIGIRLSTLDAAVKAAQAEQSEAESLPFPEVEPHPEPIDPAELLNEVSDTIKEYIVVDEHQATAATLWVAMTWLGDVLDYAPLAIISAPEKSCGKTQLLAVLGHMSCRPMHTSNSSVSSLFRSVEYWKPTVLIDEADTFFRANKELHGMVNAGYHRSGVVIRSESVNGRIVPRSFSVYSPKALAGIDLKKHLPDAAMSRGIVINLRRKLPHESVSRLRDADSSSFAGKAAKLARFAEDYSAQVRQAKPALPDALSDRDQDNWEPLLAIAECAGEDWFARATAAALALSGTNERTANSGSRLLADIKQVFVRKKLDKISTAALIMALCEDDENAWATYDGRQPITARQLASLLEVYGIKSQLMRLKRYDNPVRGFKLAQFSDAFDRYLPSQPSLPLQPLPSPQANKHGGLAATGEKSSTDAQPPSVAPEDPPILGCNTVTDKAATQVGPDGPRLHIDQRMNPMLPKALRI
jgi:putative DNA primase/helicase